MARQNAASAKCTPFSLIARQVMSSHVTSIKSYQIQGTANTSDQHRSNWKKLPGQEMPADVGPHESRMALQWSCCLLFLLSAQSCSMHQCLQTWVPPPSLPISTNLPGNLKIYKVCPFDQSAWWTCAAIHPVHSPGRFCVLCFDPRMIYPVLLKTRGKSLRIWEGTAESQVVLWS